MLASGKPVKETALTKSVFTDMGRLLDHLPLGSADQTLLVLKGHLLLEELLQEYISSKVSNPDALKRVQLRFADRLVLAQALQKQ